MFQDVVIWVGIVICVVHSGVFSGLNLALFSLSRLRLEIEAEKRTRGARRILALREDSNFMLTTILWGNVAVNCLLTLLCDSVLTGVFAFLFSTVGITLFGEIIPQAYFSRHALVMGSRLAPVLRFYQIVLYPVAKPTAKLLDMWLGAEGIGYLRERDMKALIEKHMHADEADLEKKEGVGLLNFLTLDDLPIGEEGEPIDPRSILKLPANVDLPIIPHFRAQPNDEFVKRVEASGRKWVVLIDETDTPKLVLDSDAFIRGVFSDGDQYNAYRACHRPIVISNAKTPLGRVMPKLVVCQEHDEDDVVDQDTVILWTESSRRIITGADLLGRLLRGIVKSQRETAKLSGARRQLRERRVTRG